MKYGIIFCILLLLLTASLREVHADAIADSYDPIANDIQYIPVGEYGDSIGYVVTRLDSYTIGTSGVGIYNDGGGTGTTAGAIKIRGMTNRTIQVDITNMQEAGTNTITIEIANGLTTPTLWSVDAIINYNGTVSSSGTQTGSINIMEPHDFVRVSAKREGVSSADFTIKESYTREK